MIEDILVCPRFFAPQTAYNNFNWLYKSLTWYNSRLTSSGQTITIKRKMAYFSHDGRPYNYAGLELPGAKWNTLLLDIKDEIENFHHIQLNSVLLNLYMNGKDEIRWHSDKEP